MDVSGFLAGRGNTFQPALFPGRPVGPVKAMAGRLLAVANAGAGGYQLAGFRDEFYQLKGDLLRRYGTPCGTDWQEIERPCWGCEACSGSWADAKCDGKGVFDRYYVPLARTRLGRHVFHTPGLSTRTRPAAVKFKGRLAHRAVSEADAKRAFLLLCLAFDLERFRRLANRLYELAPDQPPF